MSYKRWRQLFAATVVAATSLVVAHPASALMPQVTGSKYTITVKVTSGTKLTAIVLSAGGRQLASAAVSYSPQTLTLTTARVASIKGASLHFVNSVDYTVKSSKEGDYFGPVVLSWYGTSSSSATKVYRRLKASSSTSLNLGSITVKKVGSGKQGYAIATSKQTEADTSLNATTKASAGKPAGVGTYGKAASTKIAALGVSSDVRTLATPDFVGDSTLGGDVDDDGIPNAFDVNDDGDAKTDSADSVTPTPAVDVDAETSGGCSNVNFRIFTNFKATQPGFAGTINNYGVGPFKADSTNIPQRIKETMSMVFSPINSVCGSNVTKTELKGIGVPYAPSTYVVLGQKCGTGDYQWLIGKGKMCGGPNPSDGYAFGSADYAFTTSDLPSGQDTFSMRVTTANGNVYEFTSSAGFVFVTHPMLAAFCSGSSDTTSCTSQSDYTMIDYANPDLTGPDGARVNYTMSLDKNEFLFLAIYRPQRLAIDGETAGYYDLGGFKWAPDIPNGPSSSQGPGLCDSLSRTDSTGDVWSDVSNPRAMTVVWNISSCYTAKGKTWTVGDADFDIQVQPSGPGGNSAQKVRLQFVDNS